VSARVAAGICVLVGLVGGLLARPFGGTPTLRRGAYQVIEADFHVHSASGDGVVSPFGLVFEAQRRGLQAIAITNHNQVFVARIGQWFSRAVGGPTVLVGEEITAPSFHLIGVGLDQRVSWRTSAPDAIAAVHARGGVAIAAHPVAKYWAAYDSAAMRSLDGSEVAHPLAFQSTIGMRELSSFYQRSTGTDRRLTAIGASDFHWLNWLGACRTYVFVHENTERQILDALREGRTVVYDASGRAIGDSSLVAVLEREPLPHRNQPPTYAAFGSLDRIARVMGWLGLLGLAVLL
jgi:hypothetical protein